MLSDSVCTCHVVCSYVLYCFVFMLLHSQTCYMSCTLCCACAILYYMLIYFVLCACAVLYYMLILLHLLCVCYVVSNDMCLVLFAVLFAVLFVVLC